MDRQMREMFLPEGYRLQTAWNREMTASLPNLRRAMETGAILEGMAVLCDRDFTLTVELCDGLQGYILRDEVAYIREPVRDVAVLSRVGKAVCFCVCDMSEDGRILLSRRAAQEKFWAERVQGADPMIPGEILPARVTHLEPFGAFVDIGCGVVSMLPIDCISVSRISHPADRFRPGSRIRVAVKEVDGERQRIGVTHKELLGTWEENAADFAPGQTVGGIVRSVESYGIFVELTPNLAGLAELKPGVQVGDTATVFIKSILPERMKIKLVLVDSYGEETGTPAPIRYRVPEGQRYLSAWHYSPDGCGKVIKTTF